jgi:hypothetical protein
MEKAQKDQEQKTVMGKGRVVERINLPVQKKVVEKVVVNFEWPIER